MKSGKVESKKANSSSSSESKTKNKSHKVKSEAICDIYLQNKAKYDMK